MTQAPPYEWHHEGGFVDSAGERVRPCDDVVLLEAIVGRDKYGSPLDIPAGTIGTVLLFQLEPDGVTELECDWPRDDFSFGFAATRTLRLQMRAEEKLT